MVTSVNRMKDSWLRNQSRGEEKERERAQCKYVFAYISDGDRVVVFVICDTRVVLRVILLNLIIAVVGFTKV